MNKERCTGSCKCCDELRELKMAYNVRNDDAKDYAKEITRLKAKRSYWEQKYKKLAREKK